jgi:hypothetical protein
VGAGDEKCVYNEEIPEIEMCINFISTEVGF